MTEFITFESRYDHWPNGQKDLFHASYYLNKWLEECPQYEIVKWQAVPMGQASGGTDYLIAIVVEYKTKEVSYSPALNDYD